MNAAEQILEMLCREKTLFAQAEQITESAQAAPAEELAALTARRGRLLGEACRLHQQEKQLCRDDAVMLAAWSNAAQPDCLSPEKQKIYDAALEAKAIANRIRENSDLLYRRLEQEKAAAKERFDELNSDGVRTIQKYVHVMRGGEDVQGGRKI
jgi:hypothetical protein